MSQRSMPGAPTDEQNATADVQKVCDEVKADLLKHTDRNGFTEYTALKFKSQVVAGTNYFVKIQVEADECVHVRIFMPLPCNNENSARTCFLHGHQLSKSKNDPIDYFAPANYAE